MMYDCVYAEKEEFERRKEAERMEREFLLRKASRIVKKNKDDEETQDESENMGGGTGKHVRVDHQSDISL